MNLDTHELSDFMKMITREISDEYERIQKRATEDPGTAGDQGEENWAMIFKNWLPSNYHVVTKGRILSPENEASPQVDVLILHPSYPLNLLNKKLYLAGGVIAAFECKLTLKAEHIRDALNNAVQIRRLLPKRTGTPYKELNSGLVYGLLTHSHSWKNPNSQPKINIEENLFKYDFELVKHPLEMLDVICVADLDFWCAWKFPMFSTEFVMDNPETRVGHFAPAIYQTQTAYMGHIEVESVKSNFIPVGALISYLFRKFAREDVNIRKLAEYFISVNLEGNSGGRARHWPIDYSIDVIQFLQNKINKDLRLIPDENLWNEFFSGKNEL